MFKKFVFVLATVFACCNLIAQSKADKIAQTILSLLNTQVVAWNNGNIPKFMETYWKSDSLIFIGKNGATYGWQQTKDNYLKNYPNTDAMGKLKFEILKIKKLGTNFYNVVGKWFLERPKVGDVGGAFTLILENINGKWVIVQDHSS
jgi:hypothetical protein